MESNRASLIELDDSLLIVIDVQQYFLNRLAEEARERLSLRVCWLVDVALRLDVPLVVTGEDIPRYGSAIPGILERLPPGVQVHNKPAFGLVADPAIMADVEATGRKTAVLVGLETDVCVAQSALGLMSRGYRVVAVEDALGSPGTGHQFGLQRMRDAGVTMTSVKGLFYEWVRTVERDNAFWEAHADEIEGVGAVKL